MKLLLLLTVVMATSALPQNWPYRDNHEYYGYQNRNNNFYRASHMGSGSGEDDEIETTVTKQRQDLKVGVVEGGSVVGQSPGATAAVTNAAAASPTNPVVVVETGSAKPVAVADTKQGTQPKTPTDTSAAKQPAFPPATPPNSAPPATPPTDEDSEEDSDEDEEADENENDNEQDDDDEDDDNEDNRRRNDPVVMETNTTSNVTVVRKVKPVKQSSSGGTQTVEALVPGYVTEQGEVLVPFDTVVKDGDGGVVAVVEDPTYNTKSQPAPVVLLPSDDSSPNSVTPDDRPVPKFFNPNGEKQLYYSEVPPPGAIFTFDDDEDVNSVVSVARQGETSSEEAQEDEDDTSSAQDDDASQSEEEDVAAASSRPPLSFVKATAPSGEDDEAESLGIRIARMSTPYDPRYSSFYASRSPNFFYNGNGYYVTRYPPQQQYQHRRHGYYYQQQPYDNIYENYNQYTRAQEPIYYYRPASNEKVKVVPIGSFDVSLESMEGGEVKAVVSPFHYTNRRPTTPQQIIQRRRPVTHSSNTIRPRPVVHSSNRIIIRRQDNKHSPILAVYNVEGGTPVTRQRNSNKKQRREAKELKKNKKNKKVDPLGLLGKNDKKVAMEKRRGVVAKH